MKLLIKSFLIILSIIVLIEFGYLLLYKTSSVRECSNEQLNKNGEYCYLIKEYPGFGETIYLYTNQVHLKKVRDIIYLNAPHRVLKAISIPISFQVGLGGSSGTVGECRIDQFSKNPLLAPCHAVKPSSLFETIGKSQSLILHIVPTLASDENYLKKCLPITTTFLNAIKYKKGLFSLLPFSTNQECSPIVGQIYY